ncbi:acyl-CoA dehydrogenase family protein [Cohnella silvisoli]|uniref:Acyl-CoA dehydrogenase family protein n=1 Tax=Cohnella silvisoli TaxID=2873699 RepID=A0ABV1KM08_9BACL|nr:acyl-CoA dehydrogenase family protein [Cohnella silvisoli]MCD9020544.1 acyl-CoA dehydrogenase family protein [Cohnella silvisoli]
MSNPVWGGGRFIVDDAEPEQIVTPEDFTEEQKMLAETVRAFVERDVKPRDADIEKLDYELTVRLMRKAGEIGLLGADVPEAYGGLGLDKTSTTLLSETLSPASSFALSVGAHTGIGTLPIVFFGTQEHKSRWLPQLASGELIAAYCLTEPGSGSDALGARTNAVLSDDGQHYILNGSKLYITNAGFADLFIVYAKVDGVHFSAFIVERGTSGFTIGPEEHKMGIKGSSTRPLFFEDARIPVDHLLGEAGKGHLIAFNILNIGRFKLAAGCLGGMKEAIQLSSAYANQRKQFGKPISSFPLVAAKLADMNTLAYVTESMVYRTAGLIDQSLSQADLDGADGGLQAAKAIAEYVLECSINKVFASEAMDAVVDEGVQIHGGCGYIQEYKIERLYRDSRINRIFEGTNEINRLLIPATLLKRALKGELPLVERAQALQRELLNPSPLSASTAAQSPLSKPIAIVAALKKVFLMVGGLAVQKHGLRLEREQEIVASLADFMIDLYALESALLRARKITLNDVDPQALQLPIDMTALFAEEAAERAGQRARVILAALEKGESLRLQLSVLKRLLRFEPADLSALRKRISARVISAESYALL